MVNAGVEPATRAEIKAVGKIKDKFVVEFRLEYGEKGTRANVNGTYRRLDARVSMKREVMHVLYLDRVS